VLLTLGWAGFEPAKGVGKGFSHVVGVTAAGGPEGQSPYGNSQSEFGFQSSSLRLILERPCTYLIVDGLWKRPAFLMQHQPSLLFCHKITPEKIGN